MKRFVSTLAVLFILVSALAGPASAIGTWPTPEKPAYEAVSAGSELKIGTWPTPEMPVYWWPVIIFYWPW
jgi:hypothetical protein